MPSASGESYDEDPSSSESHALKRILSGIVGFVSKLVSDNQAPSKEHFYPYSCRKCLRTRRSTYRSDLLVASENDSLQYFGHPVYQSSRRNSSPFDVLEDSLDSVPVGFGRVVHPSGSSKPSQKEDYEIDGKFHGTTAKVVPERPISVHVSGISLHFEQRFVEPLFGITDFD